MCMSGAGDLLLAFCFHWLPLDGSTYWILNYIRMTKEQENLAGYLKCFFKVVCKNASLARRAPQQYLAEMRIWQ